MVKDNRNVTSQLVPDTLGITKTVVLRILIEDLKKRKLCSRFVLHALSREQMDERVATCEDLLNMINGDKKFLEKVITGDESWCFTYVPEKTRQSSEWVDEHSPRPKKLLFQKSRVKKMLIGFLTAKALCTKGSCTKVALMQNIIKVC